MIYVPDKENYECFVVQSDSIIRAYEQTPRHNTSINYRDYYFQGNYIYRDGSQNFSQYATLPVCIPSNEITDVVYYRNDFPQILWIFIALCIIFFWFPIKLFTRIFKRWSL